MTTLCQSIEETINEYVQSKIRIGLYPAGLKVKAWDDKHGFFNLGLRINGDYVITSYPDIKLFSHKPSDELNRLVKDLLWQIKHSPKPISKRHKKDTSMTSS